MDDQLKFIKKEVYDKCGLKLTDFKTETESQEYAACVFQLNGRNIISRNAKITPKKAGQFVFPKSILITKGIISTNKKEGKRAFRVYPSWDLVKSKQAERTQKWQLAYFYEVGAMTDLENVTKLYKES